MNPLLKEAYTFFQKMVNVLIVDNDEQILELLKAMFASPVFNFVSSSSLSSAMEFIEKSQIRWHCWILDIDLASEDNGLSILSKNSGFPFSIILSGLRSMSIATDAMKLGARAVVDKDPLGLRRLYTEVCQTAALAFVLHGKQTPFLNSFLHLQNKNVVSLEDWAEISATPVRQIQRMCGLHNSLTPHYAIALYRTIFFLLWHSDFQEEIILNPIDSQDNEPQFKDYQQAIDYIMRKLPHKQLREIQRTV